MMPRELARAARRWMEVGEVEIRMMEAMYKEPITVRVEGDTVWFGRRPWTGKCLEASAFHYGDEPLQ